jgi:hypothetical protein
MKQLEGPSMLSWMKSLDAVPQLSYVINALKQGHITVNERLEPFTPPGEIGAMCTIGMMERDLNDENLTAVVRSVLHHIIYHNLLSHRSDLKSL